MVISYSGYTIMEYPILSETLTQRRYQELAPEKDNGKKENACFTRNI